MADWNGFKKNGTTYIPNDATARASISTIEGKIPNETTSSNPLINQSTMETALDGKADVGDVTSLSESVSDIEDKIPSNASSSNQLATRSEVSAAYKPKGNATLATLPSLTADHLNWVYNMTEDFTTTSDFAEGAGISVKAGNEVGIINIATDPDALIIKYTVLGGFIDLSEYATQASVISALANKVDKVTGKGLSANDYDNTAKGIVDNIQSNVIANTQLIKDTVGWSGKNKLPNHAVSTGNFTVNANKTVTVNGTFSAQAVLPIIDVTDDFSSKLPSGDYILASGITNENVYMSIEGYNNNSWVKSIANTINGDRKPFTIDYNGYNKLYITIKVKTGTYSNVLVEPMIVDPNCLDFTYEPYFGSTAVDWASYAKTGTVNILNNTLTDGENNNVIWTVDDKKVVTVNTGTGGASANTFLNFDIKIPKGKWVFRGTNGQTGGSDSTYYMRLRKSDGSKPSASEAIPASIESINGSETEFEVLVDELSIRCNICIYSAAGELSNLKFYPMIAPRGYKGDYAPYAMTNKELTEKAEYRDMFLQSGSGITGLNNAVTKLFELVIPYLDSNGKTSDGHFLWTGNKNLSFRITRYGGTDYQGLLIDSLASKLYVVAYNNGTVTVAEFTGTVVS